MNSSHIHAKSEFRSHGAQTSLARGAICTALVCLFSASASGDWEVAPAISVESRHSSNFQLITDDARSDSLIASTVIAELSVKQRTESTQIDGLVELSYSNYSGARILEDNDRQYLDLRLLKRLERGSFGFGVSLRRDELLRAVGSLSDPESSLVDAGDEIGQTLPDPNTNLNFATDQISREVSNYRAFGRYRLTERDQLRLSYRFVNRNLGAPDSLEAIGVTTRNTSRHVVGIELSRGVSDRTRISWDGQVSRVNREQLDTVDIYESTLGWSSRIGEQTRLSLSAGVNTTDGASKDRSGLVARAQLAHQANWGTVGVQATRNFRATIAGDLNEADRVNFTFVRPLAPKWSFQLQVFGSQLKRSTNSLVDNRVKIVSAGPSISWNFAPAWGVSAGYEYRYVDRDQEFSVGTGDDHSGTISISYQPSGIFL